MRSFTIILAVVVAASCMACDKTDATPPAPTAPVVQARTPAGPVGTVLTTTEHLRATLAADGLEGVAADATTLGTAATALSADEATKALGESLTAASGALKTAADAGDIKAVRLAYGEVSKVVVSMVAADPTLQSGRFLYECPMAKGYKRWVQVTEKMANPYMGKRMLECGMGIDPWKVEG